MTRPKRLDVRIGSLFSGYGGTDMSVIEAIGTGQVVWHADTKPASVALLDYRHPDVPNHGDITEIDYSAIDPVDVLVASWPCQPHSSAGKRLGEADPRALWPQVVRAITETRPVLFFGENVARVTSDGELRRVIRSLASLGYVGAWRCVRASDIGGCHRRSRCFIVAIDPAPYTEREAGWEPRNPEQSNRTQPTGIGPTEPGRRHHGARLTLLPTPSASNYGTNQGGAAGRVGPVRESLATMARNGRFNRWGAYAPAIMRHEKVLGRQVPEPTQPSLKNGTQQLSPRFVEWMMMLPEGWVSDVPGLAPSPASERSAMLSLLGDGVVPAQGVCAFRSLLDHLACRLDMRQTS